MFKEKERYAYWEKEMNKEINDLNNAIRSLDSRMTKAESNRDSLKISLSNTPFPSETCFDNTGYDNHRSVPPSGVIDKSSIDNINWVSLSSVSGGRINNNSHFKEFQRCRKSILN